MKQYIFHKNQKRNWDEQLETINNSLKAILDDPKSDFVVKIENYKESSPKALRGYFRLIGIIKNYLNSVNNENWTDKEISDNFKEQVGHVIRVDSIRFGKFKDVLVDKGGKLKPKSIARNSGCTYEEMNRLIEKVLQFGSDIPGCELTTPEKMEFIKYYRVK